MQVKCSYFPFILLLPLLYGLTACSTNYAPVEQRDAKSTKYSNKAKIYNRNKKRPAYHTIKKGETLYSIAWNYGLDYKTLAKWNRIGHPYTIFVGNRLRLKPGYTKKSTVYSNNKTKVVKKPKNTTAGTQGKYVKKTNTGKKYIKSTTVSSSNRQTTSYKGKRRLQWRWPIKGRIIQRFSPTTGKKGIDITGQRGALIKAAEGGKVVYSGIGLRGYGKLLIIKHNETYLSAYAHNQVLLAKEGQVIKRGDNIARLGKSGTDRYKLHFEIRKNGKPVNPVFYLPK